jgi:hypothetical protein
MNGNATKSMRPMFVPSIQEPVALEAISEFHGDLMFECTLPAATGDATR